MLARPYRLIAVVLSLVLLSTLGMRATEVQPVFDLSGPRSGPFPSDLFTVADATQLTGLRVNLPKPDCQERPSDCEDLDVINTLDGFNVQPRLSIPFTGEIDPRSVTSETVFLLELACPRDPSGGDACDEGPAPRRVGVDQVVWDPATHSLHVESDALLKQHTRYALIVTRGVRSAAGGPVTAAPEFRGFRQTVAGAYKDSLLDAVRAARKSGVTADDIAVASVFTTQSVTAVLEKIRDQIKVSTPDPVDFNLVPGGGRAVFPLHEVAAVILTQQTRTAPAFTTASFGLADLRARPGAVGSVAFGKFAARDYRVHPGDYIAPIGTRTGTPSITGVNEIYFTLIVPAGTPPPDGWPVVIAGHGGGGNKEGFTLGVASPLAAHLAQRGMATIAINAPGHGFGGLGTLTVNRSDGTSVTFSAGGRGIDQNGDGLIEGREGIRAAQPRTIIDDADGFRQTVADLMQLVRQIETGVDLDGDSLSDLSRSRIYYVAQSLGGVYGAVFMAVEPNVSAGVLNAAGGPRTMRTLTTRGDRAVVGSFLGARAPSLINVPGVTHIEQVAVPLPRTTTRICRFATRKRTVFTWRTERLRRSSRQSRMLRLVRWIFRNNWIALNGSCNRPAPLPMRRTSAARHSQACSPSA